MKQKSLSAGAVVLHGSGDARRYLLMRCFQYWDFPKGMVEPASRLSWRRSAKSTRKPR